VHEALLVAYATEEPLPKELLDLFLALSVLAESAIDKTTYTREILAHRDNLQALVKERTAEIERKNEELAIMLKEVHHRIKNNMNTINSLLGMQASVLTEPQAVQALEDAAGRVQSMMVLYDRLYRSSSFDSARMKDYLPSLVGEIVGNFPNRSSVRVDTEVEDFELDSRSLQPFGIIINELLTNIMKYAFEGRDSGRIGISAFLVEGDMVRVEIRDDGIGIPDDIDFGSSSGFGLMLIEGLTTQLQGSIRMERGSGTKIILEFPKGARDY
jgi:two-component sensor histidine kinase